MPHSPSLDAYQLIREDCCVGLRNMPEASVDIVVTSPPYNLGIAYKSYKDKLPMEAYLEWTMDWVSELERVIKPNGSFFLNLGSAPSQPLMPFQLAVAIGELWTLQNTFHWIKSITVETPKGDPMSTGHFKPINSKRFVTDCHEYIFHFSHEGNVSLDRRAIGVPYQDKSNIGRWKHTEGGDLRCRGNNWFIPYKTIRQRDKDRPHPATFPVQLAEQCIRIHGVHERSHVVDPFVGLGHAALGAWNSGVARFTGFDIEESYLKCAREQLEKNAGEPAGQAELFSD
ncbi:MAG: site-specific DNA-methyltransferase [Opitutales bacterium]|nr:site-specific DNA-methyltransferase [Opitutales bacterium]